MGYGKGSFLIDYTSVQLIHFSASLEYCYAARKIKILLKKLKGKYMDGQMDKIKGRIKQAAGDLTNNKRLKAVGKAQEFRGNVKNKIDEVADKLKKQV